MSEARREANAWKRFISRKQPTTETTTTGEQQQQAHEAMLLEEVVFYRQYSMYGIILSSKNGRITCNSSSGGKLSIVYMNSTKCFWLFLALVFFFFTRGVLSRALLFVAAWVPGSRSPSSGGGR